MISKDDFMNLEIDPDRDYFYTDGETGRTFARVKGEYVEAQYIPFPPWFLFIRSIGTLESLEKFLNDGCNFYMKMSGAEREFPQKNISPEFKKSIEDILKEKDF